MTYVQQEFKPKQMVDVASLTGAVKVALGLTAAGLFSNNDEFAAAIRDSGLDVYEECWHLPISREH